MAYDTQLSQSRQQKERFRKRRLALFKKATAMLDNSTDVFIVLRRRDRFYTYTSNNKTSWPPSIENLVRTLANVGVFGLIG